MRRSLVIILLLLLLGLFLRVSNALSFPVFVDESEHIRWANEVYDVHLFAGANSGRLFGLWWMSLFGLQQDSALFLSRVATALFNMITMAVLFDLGRRWVDVKTGTLAALLYAIAPYTIFHERLGLTDSYVTVWAALAAWFAVRYTRRMSVFDAISCGLALVAAFFAKATGLTMIAIPGLIILFAASPRVAWQRYWRGLLGIYGIFAVGAAVGFGFLRWRGYSYLGAASTVVGTKDTDNIFERLWNGLEAVWKIDVRYFSLPFLLLALALAVYLLMRRWRIALILIGATVIPLVGLLAFAVKYSARYFHFHVPFLLLLVAIGLGQLAQDVNRRSRAVGFAVMLLPLLLWGALFALPFQFTYHDDPASLALPELDRLEYVVSDASGFALPEVADYLRAQTDGQPLVVVGLLANCGGLDFYVADAGPIRLICPTLYWDGSHQSEIADLVNQLATENEVLWIVLEESVYVNLEGITASFDLQTTFHRPEKLTDIEILRTTIAE